jgi:hypothetical protein
MIKSNESAAIARTAKPSVSVMASLTQLDSRLLRRIAMRNMKAKPPIIISQLARDWDLMLRKRKMATVAHRIGHSHQ